MEIKKVNAALKKSIFEIKGVIIGAGELVSASDWEDHDQIFTEEALKEVVKDFEDNRKTRHIFFYANSASMRKKVLSEAAGKIEDLTYEDGKLNVRIQILNSYYGKQLINHIGRLGIEQCVRDFTFAFIADVIEQKINMEEVKVVNKMRLESVCLVVKEDSKQI